jgi:hypothetical protein
MAARLAEQQNRLLQLGNEYGGRVRPILKQVLTERFGRVTQRGEQAPVVAGVMTTYPVMSVVRVSTQHLYKSVRIDDLKSESTLHAIAGALAAAQPPLLFSEIVTVDSVPSPGGFRDKSAIFYVILIQPAPALDAPKEPEVELSGLIEIDFFAEYPRGKSDIQWLIGHDGRKLVWRDLESLGNVSINGTTQWGKFSLWGIPLLTALLNNGPDKLQIAVIDPKMVNSAWLVGAPHHLVEPCRSSNLKDAARVMSAVRGELERRKMVMSSIGATGLARYNERVEPEDRMPRLALVFDDMLDILQQARDGSPFAEDFRTVVTEGLAFGVQSVLVVQRADARTVESRITSNVDTRLTVRCLNAPHWESAMQRRNLYHLNSRLTTKGAAVALLRGEVRPLIVKMPYFEGEPDMRIMQLTSHWRDGRQPNEPAAIPVGTPLVSDKAKRLVRWALENLPRKAMPRPPLVLAFDRKDGQRLSKAADGGPRIGESEIAAIQKTLAAQGLLSGGGRGSTYHVTPKLEAIALGQPKAQDELAGHPTRHSALGKEGE